ncbi:MAG TPA: hypothetical protein VGE95_16900 [Arthrobacter sp.]
MEQIILIVLAACSVVSAVVYGVKQLLDQLPDVFASWHRAVAAWHKSDDDAAMPAPASSDSDAD